MFPSSPYEILLSTWCSIGPANCPIIGAAIDTGIGPEIPEIPKPLRSIVASPADQTRFNGCAARFQLPVRSFFGMVTFRERTSLSFSTLPVYFTSRPLPESVPSNVYFSPDRVRGTFDIVVIISPGITPGTRLGINADFDPPLISPLMTLMSKVPFIVSVAVLPSFVSKEISLPNKATSLYFKSRFSPE